MVFKKFPKLTQELENVVVNHMKNFTTNSEELVYWNTKSQMAYYSPSKQSVTVFGIEKDKVSYILPS